MQLPPQQRGITVLGAPVGTREYKQHHLQQLQTRTQHTPSTTTPPPRPSSLMVVASVLRQPQVQLPTPHAPPQCHPPVCSRPRCSRCWLPGRNARLQPTTRYCPCHSPPAHSGTEASDSHRPSILATPAYWASWADALQVLGRQAPQQAATLLHQFQSEEPPPSIQEAAEAAAQLQQHGFEPPAWDQLMNNPPVPPDPHPHEGPNIMKGWQQGAANACHTTFQAELHSCLDPASQALLESQRGPHASRPFTTIPYHADTTYESVTFSGSCSSAAFGSLFP